MIVAGLMIPVGIALIAFNILARVSNRIFDRIFRRRRAGYGYTTLIVLVLAFSMLRFYRPITDALKKPSPRYTRHLVPRS